MMWAQIELIINLTCINLCALVPDLHCCMEILGFDIMLDEHMKPWLIEVNSSPAMSMDTGVDNLVKPALIRDAMNITSFEPYSSWLDRTRTRSTTKTSNIHQNFFSKRTTATNRKDEGVQLPPSAPSAHTKKLSVRDKYDTRTTGKQQQM